MSRIATAIGIVKDVLESNHPTATIKSAEAGPCHFRVSSVGASITVSAHDDFIVTDDDISEIEERGAEEISGRRLEYRKEDDDTVWFELHS